MDVTNIDDVQKNFPEFQVERKIGKGGEGIVYLVYDYDREEWSALKILHAKGELAQWQFEKEGRLMTEFEHTNVIKAYSYGYRDGMYYTHMEYCEAGSLLDVIAAYRFTDEQAAKIVMQVARGLHFVHMQKVLHRDIKPQNVMMTSDWIPKLVDFGICFCAGEDRNALKPVGTEGYAAPEIWNDASQISIQSDIYAMGALMYTCLAQIYPDPHNVNFNKIFDRHNGFLYFILKAMNKDAHKRHASVKELFEELEVILAELKKLPSTDVG